jgi:chromosomal replication initiation ATPase DnaA
MTEEVEEYQISQAQLMIQLCDLDGMIENIDAQLHNMQGWRDGLAAKIQNAPAQYGYPVTDHQRIMRIVPAVTGISWDRLRGKQRSQPVVNARWLAINMLTEHSKYSSAEVGRFLNKDHTTILHARKSWQRLYVKDQEFRRIADSCWYKLDKERV